MDVNKNWIFENGEQLKWSQSKKGAPILHTYPSTLSKALQYMRNTREVQPNFGFLQQLAEMDNGLRKERYRQSGFRG